MNEDNSFKNEKVNKFLLIDNYSQRFQTDRIERIEEIIRGCEVKGETKTIHFTQLKSEMVHGCVGIILSGSELNVSEFYLDEKLRGRFNSQLDLIKNNYQIPILAICFGFHLVAYAYGVQVSRMRIPGLRGRIIFILIKKTDELISHKNIPVNAHHLDYVPYNDSNNLKNFEILCVSRAFGYDIVQYMKHIDKPIYALQFHPETHYPQNFPPTSTDERITNKTRMIGQEIIENFIRVSSYNKK
jgi:GMP synthase-like glutamine amidotransferase